MSSIFNTDVYPLKLIFFQYKMLHLVLQLPVTSTIDKRAWSVAVIREIVKNFKIRYDIVISGII